MTAVAASRHARFAWFLGLCLAAVGAAHAAETESDPPGRVARLSLIDGEVSFAPAGTDEWAEAVLNRPITSEDRVWVGVDGRAELQVGSASVHLDRETQFGFIELDDDIMQMSLVDGAATIRVRRLREAETIKVETPNATVHLTSVGEYHLEVDPDRDLTVVKTRNGQADVSGAGKHYVVRSGERGEFSGLDDLTAQMNSIEPRTPFEAWANDRDRREERAESARYVSRDVVGYEDLDDHGEWIHEREYGYVWRPIHVVHDWAPYRYGRWAWVSPWGWTWIDDARWGFAPFHYGRWVHVRHRWCWVPGPRHLRPIYAPALVGWIGGPHVSVSVSFGGGIGWYPLGPYEVYYPGYRHTPRYIRHVNVSNTIIVNNTYITNGYGRPRRHYDDHRYRRHEHAVTAVHRDHFVAGRSLNDRRLRVSERDLREWRDDPRPPAIAPYRESVLAGEPRQVRRDAGRQGERQGRDWLAQRGDRSRVDFAAERRAIENNGGRPVGRAQLIERPKERGDFRVSRRDDASAVKREASHRAGRSGEGPSAGAAPSREARSLDRESLQREPANRDRTVERLHAEREARSERQRNVEERALRDSGSSTRLRESQPERSAAPRPAPEAREWRQTPSTERLRAAPERDEPPARFNNREWRNERAPAPAVRQEPPRREARQYSPPPERSYSPPPERSYSPPPRRDYSPPERSQERSYSPPPESRSRSHDAGPSRSERSSSHDGSRGQSRSHGSQPRSRD